METNGLFAFFRLIRKKKKRKENRKRPESKSHPNGIIDGEKQLCTIKCGTEQKYSEFPLLGPHKIKTSYLLKNFICKVEVILFFIFYTQCTSD